MMFCNIAVSSYFLVRHVGDGLFQSGDAGIERIDLLGNVARKFALHHGAGAVGLGTGGAADGGFRRSGADGLGGGPVADLERAGELVQRDVGLAGLAVDEGGVGEGLIALIPQF